MLFYFLIFTIVGFVIGNTIIEKEKAFSVMIVVAIIWAFAYSMFWGLVSFGELTLGYFIAQMIKERS